MAITGADLLFGAGVSPGELLQMQFYGKQIERQANSAPNSARTPVDGASDPQATTRLHNYAIGGYAGQLHFHIGRVVFSFPHLNVCRVLVGGGQAERWCTPLMQSSSSTLSPIEVSLPAPNTSVLIGVAGENPIGIILGVLPSITVDSATSISDYLMQGTSIGVAKEQTFRALIENALREAGARDYSSNRPIDQTATAWAKLSPLGGGVIVDLFMSALRIDEQCGIWFNYVHRLARLAAYNFDLWTSGSQEFLRNDRGEISGMKGVTPYAWEALGLLGPEFTSTSTRNNPGEVYNSGAAADREPQSQAALPFWRWREHSGYTAQGMLRELVIPPASLERNLATSTAAEFGVFREQLSAAGDYALIAARSLAFLKRTAIPVARRRRMPEDPQGDGETDYKAAGVAGDGDDHTLGEQPVNLADFVARTLNWESMQPFAAHKKDFHLPTSAQLPHRAAVKPTFSQLKTQADLTEPTPVSMKVDHRQEEVDYYENISGDITQADGTKIILGPAGQTITLDTKGRIIFDAPGDILIRSGRSAVTLAGDDIIQRANNSVDISSAHKDIRAAAAGNMELMSGSSGTGRMLIENKATDQHSYPDGALGEDLAGSGIIFRASNSKLLSYTAGVYIRTGGRGSGIGSGDITLDAGKGEDDIITIANEEQHRLAVQVTYSFPPVDDETQTTHVLAQNLFSFDGAVEIADRLLVAANGMAVSGDIKVKAGHILTELADFGYDGRVGSFEPGSSELSALGDELQTVLNDATAHAADSKEFYDAHIGTLYTENDDTALGGVLLITALTFSFRDELQYGTSDLRMHEAHWQKLARMTQDAVERWNETPVTYRGRSLMPWPGHSVWIGSNLIQTDLTLYDPLTGRDADSTSTKYADFEPPEESPVAFQDNYRIIPHE